MVSSPDSSPGSRREELSRNSSHSSVPSVSLPETYQTTLKKGALDALPGHLIATELAGLYSESAVAKIWKVALGVTEDANGPSEYPEYVPRDGDSHGKYVTKEARFWTCGFFPGSLYALLERCMRYPKYLPSPGIDRLIFQNELLQLCRAWSKPLYKMAERTDTHDLGFITQPALRQDWELTGNHESLRAILKAAYNLASRYDEGLRAVRSWDKSVSRRYNISDKDSNFLVIVDSMCNMDLLFYASHHTSDQRLADIATAHAHFVRQHLIRENNSTWHVVNFDPRTGKVHRKYTHQGYHDESTWARGQAWTILGFAQTYVWTKDPEFLNTAIVLADHFIAYLKTAQHLHPYVPLWDFDAPTAVGEQPLRDSSAGMIAANGLLLLHQILQNQSTYLEDAINIARDTIAMCQIPDAARLIATHGSKISTVGVEFDAILGHATANNNEFAMVRYSDHGLVYADYFFLEFGNKLLRMGMV